MFPVVVVQGGAGHIPKERSENSRAGVCSAARAGYAVLRRGGSSMDAVVEAVSQLENNPFFNAGGVRTFQTDAAGRLLFLSLNVLLRCSCFVCVCFSWTCGSIPLSNTYFSSVIAA